MALSNSTIPAQPAGMSQMLPRLVPRQRKKPAPEFSEPPLPTPQLPPPPSIDSIHFMIPTCRILSKQDHDLFLSSPTYELLLSFAFSLSDSIRNTPISAVPTQALTGTGQTIVNMLDETERLISSNPPLDTGSRFGNPAFRSYVADITKRLPEWHTQLAVRSDARPEVSTYFQNSFGSVSRIDYGSGHELNFILWLLCLNRLGLLPPSTFPSLALIVFPRYLRLMRAVQTTYYLEPAGSHGVWGLDDYQFLPFLLGASQLLHHPFITPKAIHSQATLEDYSKDYLYLDQVAFVNSVKNVDGLRWHSPMLDDISAAKNWEKIEAGMKKMFVKEVLGKLPVMQHFLFGSLIPAVEGMSMEKETQEGDRTLGEERAHPLFHQHGENAWGDCCGIPVPSSIGAAQEMKKRMGGEGLRRLPFD